MTAPTHNTCPVCGCEQPDGLLCHDDTLRLEQALGDVRSIVEDLDIALSKQARIGTPGKGGLARERSPINLGAMEAADTLGNVLTTWIRDVRPDTDNWRHLFPLTTVHAARLLLSSINAIRKHPAVAELVDEITDAVEQARRAVDRPADRQYLGQCMAAFPDEDGQDVTCYAEIWAREGAHEVTCRVCGIEHPVAERRKWLMERAAEMVVTAKEASRYLSDVGQLDVSETSIRNWVGRRKVLLRPGLSTQRQFELGALMDYIAKRDADAASRVVAELPLAV